MSNQRKARVLTFLPSKSLNHLPPKSPTTAATSAHLDSLRPHNGHFRTPNHCAGYEKHDNDSEINPPIEPSWLNELLDSPKISDRRFSHRRSASDTVAFLEAPSNLAKVGGVVEEDEYNFPSKHPVRLRGSLDFDQLDEEQFVQMFSHLQLFENSPGKMGESFSQAHHAAAAGLSRSLIESWTPFSNVNCSTSAQKNYCGQSVCRGDTEVAKGRYLKGGLEVEGARVGINGDEGFKYGDHSSTLENDVSWEVQQTRRPSNRQSAQRSRVRKLQYIAELERRVNVLQIEVAALSPQVAYLDHQRSLLTADNKALKQRMMVALNEKQFKIAHFEVMKEERERLKLLLYQQNSQLASHLQVSTSQLYPGLLQDEEAAPAVTDAFVRLVKASSMAPSTEAMGMTKGWTGRKTSAVKNFTPFSCTPLAENSKSLEAAILSSDFMVQNP